MVAGEDAGAGGAGTPGIKDAGVSSDQKAEMAAPAVGTATPTAPMLAAADSATSLDDFIRFAVAHLRQYGFVERSSLIRIYDKQK